MRPYHPAASDANGLEPFARIPPHFCPSYRVCRAGGILYPLQRKGSEFNQLAPPTPEGRIAPRSAMPRRQADARAPPCRMNVTRHISRIPSMQKHNKMQHKTSESRGKMSDKDKTHYTSRLSVHVTPAMQNRLDQIATLRDLPKAEIVRAALRMYLDEQEDLITSRKHFTKMFQRRVDYIERLVVMTFWLNVQMMHILQERVLRETGDLGDLLQDAIGAGIATEDGIHQLIAQAVQQKTKPPRP